MKYTYQLTEHEIQEALLNLSFRRYTKVSHLNLWIMTGIGVLLLIQYIKDT